MQSYKPALAVLVAALGQPKRREKLIEKFQNIVWNFEGDRSEEAIWNLLGELAYDLDFYVADEAARLEDPAYFGEEKAGKLIASTLEQLKLRGISISDSA